MRIKITLLPVENAKASKPKEFIRPGAQPAVGPANDKSDQHHYATLDSLNWRFRDAPLLFGIDLHPLDPRAIHFLDDDFKILKVDLLAVFWDIAQLGQDHATHRIDIV